MNSKRLTIIFTVLITIVLLALLFTQINLVDVITVIKNINPIYLVAGFILYTSSYFFRAWRFYILLNKEVSIKDLFNIGCVHNMINNLLPARTGELSYIYLLKNVNDRTTGEGVATLVVARIFDFMVISVFFIFSLFINRNVPSGLMDFLWIGIVFFVIMIIFILSILFSSGAILTQIKKFFGLFHIETTSFGFYFIQKSEESINCINAYKTAKTKIMGKCLILSILIWSSIYSMTFLLMYAMNFKLSFSLILLGSTFAIFSTILPIQGIGGFGTTESAWAIGFILLGISKQDAINSGFGYHIIVLIFTIIMGSLGIFLLKKKRLQSFLQYIRFKKHQLG